MCVTNASPTKRTSGIVSFQFEKESNPNRQKSKTNFCHCFSICTRLSLCHSIFFLCRYVCSIFQISSQFRHISGEATDFVVNFSRIFSESCRIPGLILENVTLRSNPTVGRPRARRVLWTLRASSFFVVELQICFSKTLLNNRKMYVSFWGGQMVISLKRVRGGLFTSDSTRLEGDGSSSSSSGAGETTQSSPDLPVAADSMRL